MKDYFPHRLNALLGSPKHKSIMYMALASAIHFAAYEVARNGILALLTSRQYGFSSASAISFATACISPVSILLLWAYTRALDSTGPRSSLYNSTGFSAILLAYSGIFLGWTHDYVQDYPIYHTLSQVVLAVTFIVENAFVQLLYSQHSSFLSSIQSKDQGAVWFAPISGLGSIASTLASAFTPLLVLAFGLPYLLVVASLLLLCSAWCSDKAYEIAEQNDFAPDKVEQSSSPTTNQNELSLFERAWSLFQRVPLLGALCIEVLICQCLSSLIHFLFMVSYKESILLDEDRARYTGKSYAWINGVSGLLQFGILPVVMKRVDTRILWVIMPTAMCISALWLSLSTERSLFQITICFGLMKTIEYSLRGVLTEMVYISLDYESRFLGKEIIGLTANRFGKSIMALTTALFGATLDYDYFLVALVILALLWMIATFRVVRLANGGEVKTKAD